MASARMTSKGQITVPKEVRDRLGLHTGDRVNFRIEENQSVRMFPASRKVSEVFGILSRQRKKKAVSVEDMDKNLKKAFRKGKS